MLDRRLPSHGTRAVVAPIHFALASIVHPLSPTPDWRHSSSSPPREVCSATPRVPGRWAGDATIDRLGHRYRQSRIDVAIAHSVLEQYSSLGSSAFSHRNDGERRPVRATWPCNRSGYLGFYWSRHRAYCWRFPEAIGFFSSLMKIDFITALASPSASDELGRARNHLPQILSSR